MPPAEAVRPNPDALLARVQDQERKAARGKLRIYFGASAGVGKTYAMLQAARKLAAEGVQVLVGVVETHGRTETEALLQGLAVLPRRELAYRGHTLAEFDIDAALARRPALVLVDELAHSNAPGSRHAKRWQDVDELLAAGIDVFSTVNVQHLESLNDVVGGITGVRVNETVPDSVFDQADEVVLVDLPADELLARLRAGKVYQGPQAERASQNFFRKGNLIALRELALRRTADRVDDDVRAYRGEQAIDAIWKTGAALLACVGPDAEGEHVVRSAARLAGQLGTSWHAVYVETPALQRLPASERSRILGYLKLAEELGAVTAVLSGPDVAAAVVEYARGHNLSKVLLGARRGWTWRTPPAQAIQRCAPDIDLIEVGQAAGRGRPAVALPRDALAAARARWPSYVWAGGISLATTALAYVTLARLDLANIAMVFLLAVLLVAYRFGRGPSVLATCLCVGSFDFLFVPPRFTMAVSDLQYLITFAVMLAVGLLTGHLTAGLRFQARVAAHRERRARDLYEFARELSGALQPEQIFESARAAIESSFPARATLLLPDAEGRIQWPAGVDASAAPSLDLGVAQWAFDHSQAAGLGTDTLAGNPVHYLPLIAPMRTRGVLAIAPSGGPWLQIPEQRQHLQTFATLAAIALERVHYIEVAQGALVNMESERLRNSLLAALSHDLRTPLTTLVGWTEALERSLPENSEAPRGIARLVHGEALRLSALVANLLDMARIESGEVRFNLQWHSLEEAVGGALRVCEPVLADHEVVTALPEDLPLLQFDGVLMERVLCNLLENAAKYTPAGSHITVAARRRGALVEVTVADDGPGLPPGREEALFEKFTRGVRESAQPGVGLGLAICRAIIEAHGGTIHAEAAPGGGAAFVFTLPAGTPPPVREAESDDAGEHHD